MMVPPMALSIPPLLWWRWLLHLAVLWLPLLPATLVYRLMSLPMSRPLSLVRL